MLKKLWNGVTWIRSNTFEFLVILSILIIVILAVFRFNSTGSWSDSYYYLPPSNTSQSSAPRKDSSGEIRARQFLENYFRKPFPKSRPSFMVNHVTGSQHNLELDCFNETLRLAVEYNGAQHYKYIPFFHKNKEAFYNQKYRDELKRIRCRELGITLIEVPYTEEKRLEEYLREQLKIHGY